LQKHLQNPKKERHYDSPEAKKQPSIFIVILG